MQWTYVYIIDKKINNIRTQLEHKGKISENCPAILNDLPSNKKVLQINICISKIKIFLWLVIFWEGFFSWMTLLITSFAQTISAYVTDVVTISSMRYLRLRK